MNVQTYLFALREPIENLLGCSMTDSSFYLLAALFSGGLFVFGWLLACFIGGSCSGFILTFVAMILPIATALLAWGSIDIFLAAQISGPNLLLLLQVIGAIAFGLGAALFISRPLLGMGRLKLIIIMGIVYVLSIGLAYLGTHGKEACFKVKQQAEEKLEELSS